MKNLENAAHRLIDDILVVKPGENVAITCDPKTDSEMSKWIAEAVYEAAAFPIIIETYPPEGKGVLGEDELPVNVLSAALSEADVWIEINQRQLLYSKPFEIALERNKKIRYMVLAEMTPDVFIRTIGNVDARKLKPLILGIKDLLENSKTVRVKTAIGTDVVFEVDNDHFLGLDYGECAHPGFHTMAGCINIVPRFGSVNGDIIIDGTLTDKGVIKGERVHLEVKDGIIESISGTDAADWFRNYLRDFNDPNMYKIAHLSIGLNPGAIFSGSTPEDERGWGVTTWGIGSVPATDAPPDGQRAVSHCDGTCAKSTIWFDDRLIMKDGEIADKGLMELDITKKSL